MREIVAICVIAAVMGCRSGTEKPSDKESWPSRVNGATLGLESQEPDMAVPKADGRLLVREILRQAFLIAARDELGLATRDMTLRETIHAAPSGVAGPLAVTTADSSGDFVRVQIVRTANGRPKVIYEKEIPLPLAANDAFDYVGLVTAAEEMSRSKPRRAASTTGPIWVTTTWRRPAWRNSRAMKSRDSMCRRSVSFGRRRSS